MQESAFSLMQMARVSGKLKQLSQNGLLYIAILTDPTYGGVTASFAMLGDIAIAEPGAVICFAGARVIEETIRETLPEGFQRAEYLLEHGMIDMVVHRRDLRDTLARILSLLCHRDPPAAIVPIAANGKNAQNGTNKKSAAKNPSAKSAPARRVTDRQDAN